VLCKLAGVSKSGYYKWKSRPKEPPHDRQLILELVEQTHRKHPSHGYRWVHAYLVRHEGITVSPDYIRKAFLYLGIESKTKHKQRPRPRKARNPYPNLVFSTWETVNRPRQVIVSDMTSFRARWYCWELTFYFDVFTKQIVGYGISNKRGDSSSYYNGLDQALGKLEDIKGEPTVLHTDQGTIYTSMAYNELIKDYNVIRSFSRVGKPTDNPICESLNGWIKEELLLDFGLYYADDVAQVVDDYVKFYNSRRPCYSLGYDTPDDFYQRYLDGKMDKKDTEEGT
jgi:transposase InsO family protein